MYTIKVKTHFDAAHYIKDYPGKCSREHGHRWEVEIIIKGEKLDSLNMLVDFAGVKKIVDKLDHHQLNELLGEKHVTAEFLAKWLYNEIGAVSVTIWESPECSVTYDGDK